MPGRTLTPNFGWELPAIAGDDSAWGDVLNIAIGAIDGQIAQKLEFKSSGSALTRWRLYRDIDAEGTGDVGATLKLDAYHNDGTLIGTVLTVNRATRRVQVLQAPVDPNDVVRKADLIGIGNVPIGSVIVWSGVAVGSGTPIPPAGWLICNGATYSTAAPYDQLFAIVGYHFGGTGTHFLIPKTQPLNTMGTATPELQYIIKYQ